MGVDIFGIKPVVVSDKPVEINWDTTTDEEKKSYFEAYDKWENENPGAYFRANWWSWRPINLLCMLAQREYDIPLEIKSWDSNDGDGLKTAVECNLLADILEHFLNDKLGKLLVEDDDKIQLCLGAWVTHDGKFVDKDTENELNKNFKQGEILFRQLTTPDGRIVESAHSTPLWMFKKWIAFLRDCGGFEVC